jgi:Uma2 family endonuclease
MSAPLVRPYITYEDLCRLPSDGKRYELFDGEAYMCPAPSAWHQNLLVRLVVLFQAAIRDRSKVYVAPVDVVLDRATAVQPDLLLILETRLDIIRHAIHGAPDLVLEILSPSTTAMDRGLKMETYARYGVGEYWMVDVEREAIEIYRLDQNASAYRLVQTCRKDYQATTPLLPALSIDVTTLFAE